MGVNEPFSLFLMAFTTSLEGQVGSTLTVFATSSFSQHSLISTVYVVQGVVNGKFIIPSSNRKTHSLTLPAVIKPPMAKVADVFGRLEAFSISILLLVLGYMQMATSTNVQRFAAAQLFYSAGGTGLQILQQIFIADTSSLVNRGILSTMPAVPYMINVWIGSLIGGVILKTIGWRWGYAMWSILLPAMFIPFALTMFLNARKAKKQGVVVNSSFKGLGFTHGLKNLWVELDIGGTIILSAAFALILLPLTIASKTPNGWKSPSIVTMLVLGVSCLVAFPIWESNKTLSPRPLVPLHLLKSRTFCAGCAIGFLYFSKCSNRFLGVPILTSGSGILPFHPTLLLLLPACGPTTARHCCRPHFPVFLIHRDDYFNYRLPHHQKGQSL